MKTIALLILITAACIAASNNTDPVASRDMLAQHETIAVFVGTNYHACMGRTSRCPDKCGDSGIMATFTISAYVSYKKPGEYGDPRQGSYSFLVEDNMKNAKVTDATRSAIYTLKPGDYVLLSWQHDYVTSKGGSKWPERSVTKMQPLDKKEAETKLADLMKRDPASTNLPPAVTMPRARPMAR